MTPRKVQNDNTLTDLFCQCDPVACTRQLCRPAGKCNSAGCRCNTGHMEKSFCKEPNVVVIEDQECISAQSSLLHVVLSVRDCVPVSG